MNALNYIIALVVSFLVSLICVGLAFLIAKKFKILDYPKSERKIHKKPVPLLGGLGIFFAFNIVVLSYAFFTNYLTSDTIILKNIIGISIGSLFLIIGGSLDDKFNLKPWQQIIWPFLAIFSVIICGIGIDWITNPFSEGIIYLNDWQINLFWHNGIAYKLTLFADLLTFVWLLVMMYTTKLLDGLDGLVAGITMISAIFIFFTALNKADIIQYDVALLAMIILGSFAGFFVYNFNPAVIFLGEGGSTLAGFLLGTVSIVSGSKIGVTLMLLSIPVLDFIWTIIRRIMEGKSPFRNADKKHLHYRFLDSGMTVKQSVVSFYAIIVFFGLIAYFLQDQGLSFVGLASFASIVFLLILAYLYKRVKEA